MQVILAHAGQSHGPDPALVALLIALILPSALAAGSALRRARARRETLAVGGNEGM
jgi:hypothetical protein